MAELIEQHTQPPSTSGYFDCSDSFGYRRSTLVKTIKTASLASSSSVTLMQPPPLLLLDLSFALDKQNKINDQKG